MKTKIYLAIMIAAIFTSCSIPALLNPDSYGKKWENTFVFFNPDNLDVIYISKTGLIKNASMHQNDTDYLVLYNEEAGEFSLTIESFFHDVHAADFSGYKVAVGQEEIPWEIEGNTFRLKGTELNPTLEGFYRIALSENLTK